MISSNRPIQRIGARTIGACLLLLTIWWPLSVAAQTSDLSQLGGFGDPLGGEAPQPVFVSAEFTAASAGQPARLFVTAEMDPGWHVYSVSQPSGGPTKTRISLDENSTAKLAGPFRSLQKPKIHFEEFWPGLPIEEHAKKVVWFAPLRLPEGADPKTLSIRGVVSCQACQESCIPLTIPFTAELGKGVDVSKAPPAVDDAAHDETAGGPTEPPKLEGPTYQGEYRAERSAVVIRGELAASRVEPGGATELVITATPDPEFHIYAWADEDPRQIGVGKPTLIAPVFTDGLVLSPATTESKVLEKPAPLGEGLVERYHDGAVTWTVRIQVPEDAVPGPHTIAGIIGYQVCRETSCQPPQGARFQVTLEVGPGAGSTSVPVTFAKAKYGEAAQAAIEFKENAAADDEVESATDSLWLIIGPAFLGGLILNLMPCVLPVIGLKILGFVEQAGENRARVFVLNLWYSIGLMVVFLLLAVMAASVQLGIADLLVQIGVVDEWDNLGWGEQFTFTWFKVFMAALVFVMALSFLGVWEIPIPGFAGAGKATQLASKEGIAGAFSKGIFTTILATPCSGPFLGPVFAYTTSQPASTTFLVFGSVGLGMASPYLLIGVFPKLVYFLPKPGAWMETFKQLMGFLLLGTVVYLFSTIGDKYLVSTMALLVALWFGCWWIGRTPITASTTKKVISWCGSGVLALLVGYFAFVPGKYELEWEPFSPARLAEAQAEGKTVLVDFSADWCPTCKFNLKTAINTKKVQRLVKENRVVTLLADWTDRSDLIKNMLARLNSRSIPLLAIYPASDPKNPIVLRDLLVEGDVLEALESAGPSKELEEKEAGDTQVQTNAERKTDSQNGENLEPDRDK